MSTQAATAILILPLIQAQNNPIGKAESKSKRKIKRKRNKRGIRNKFEKKKSIGYMSASPFSKAENALAMDFPRIR